MSAQQIPRNNSCDFCFCFRSDIICLQVHQITKTNVSSVSHHFVCFLAILSTSYTWMSRGTYWRVLLSQIWVSNQDRINQHSRFPITKLGRNSTWPGIFIETTSICLPAASTMTIHLLHWFAYDDLPNVILPTTAISLLLPNLTLQGYEGCRRHFACVVSELSQAKRH